MAEVFDFGLQQHKIKMDGKFFENNLFAVAGDTGRRLEVQLLDSDNLVQNTTGISLRLNADVAGQATYAEAVLVDATKGLYELDLPNGMLVAPGNWQFQWQIIGATGEKLHSFAFVGSIGSNLSEGGTEATNFYLNVDDLKQMQEDLINGTFNSEVLETNIAEKLTDLETQYAPKLTEVTAQLAQTATKTELQAVASGSPKNIYATYSDLQSAHPNGNSNIYVVRQDGNWYYWGGSTWVSGGIYQSTFVSNGVTVRNIISNGNFNATTGWTANGGSIASAANELIFTITEGSVYTYIGQNTTVPTIGHKYYVKGDTFARKTTSSYISFGGKNIAKTLPSNSWSTISGVTTAETTSAFRFYHNTSPDTGYVVGDTLHFRRMLVVDLTVSYGTGNEPTTEEFEKVLSVFENSWFEGEAQIVPPMNIDNLVTELNQKVDKSEIENLIGIPKKIINVSQFANLRKTMESISLPAEVEYEIQIPEGTYDLLTMYSQSEIEATSFVGFIVPNNVSLVGVGKKENTVIKMEIPENWLPATIARVAPLANMGRGDLKNITVIGRNCRYTVHDDYAYVGVKKLIKNCTFIKLSGLGNSQAWGEGYGSGMEFIFEDTEFITEYAQAPYSTHNNLNHSAPSYHQFKRCKFKNASGYFGVRFITLDSGQIHKVDMIDCYVEGVIKAEEYESGISGYRYDLNITGTPETRILIDGERHEGSGVLVNGETMRKLNAESTAITKGTPVKLNNDGQVVQRLSANSTKLIYGIAMEDIAPNTIGTIKTSGYLAVADTGLALVTGDLVGVVDGQLGKVTSGDIIGVANQRDFIKLTFS